MTGAPRKPGNNKEGANMSNADSRSTHTDALDTLGSIIDDTQKRDAIHLAVYPAIAAVRLRAGQHVGLMDDGRATNDIDKHVGIVDPFLTTVVNRGQRFWLVVYPRQITSLRHVWEHPAFPASGETDATAPAVSADEVWIRDFADRVGLGYWTIMDGAREWVASQRRDGYGEYLCFGGLLEGEHVPDEFWEHYEAVTGEQVSDSHRGSFFTCSC